MIQFIYPLSYYNSPTSYGTTIHQSQMILHSIYPQWHYHAYIPNNTAMQLSSMILQCIYLQWYYNTSISNDTTMHLFPMILQFIYLCLFVITCLCVFFYPIISLSGLCIFGFLCHLGKLVFSNFVLLLRVPTIISEKQYYCALLIISSGSLTIFISWLISQNIIYL